MNTPKISKQGATWMCQFETEERKYEVALKELQHPSTTLHQLAQEHKRTAEAYEAAARALAGWKP